MCPHPRPPSPASCSAFAPPLYAQQARLLVSGDWLEENLSRADLVILHASSDGSDYEEEHIPGARLVLLDRIAWDGATGVGVELRGLSELRDALSRKPASPTEAPWWFTAPTQCSRPGSG